MGATGGAATAIGIWYQTIGAAAALIHPWTFKSIEPYLEFEKTAIAYDQRPKLIVEYFDMDAAIIEQGKAELIQFKVSTQRDPSGFTRVEVWEILQNATRAILRHENEKSEKIVGFIVASNRPMGLCFNDLQETVKSPVVELDNPEFLAQFANAPAPSSLFPMSTKKATSTEECTTGKMRDLALEIMCVNGKQSKEKTKERIDACLKAMACFRFANAKPDHLKEKLHEWFQTWGILKDEGGVFIDLIVGALQSNSSTDTAHTEISIMNRMFHSEDAVPISPRYVWQDVVKHLLIRRAPDPPTENYIERNGVPHWLLNRTALLRGLPYKYQEDPTAELASKKSYSKNIEVQPRIIALVGDGGNGKSALMYHLLEQIARGVWDWEAEDFQPEPKFIGYPIIRPPGRTAIEAIRGALENWGHRYNYTQDPIKRFAAASRCKEGDSAVWVGLDGVDEVSEANLSDLAYDLANWAYSNTNVRFVLTCREEHFGLMINGLSQDGLMRHINVSEFNLDDAWYAVMKATNEEFQRPQLTSYAAVGERKDVGMIPAADPEGFEESIRQPLFVGVIRSVYINRGVHCIKAAYEGNTDAFKIIAKEYIDVFCERVRRRFNRTHVNHKGIFRALKQVAENVDKPQRENQSYWKSACKKHLGGRIEWYMLFDQCVDSGLIISKPQY